MLYLVISQITALKNKGHELPAELARDTGPQIRLALITLAVHIAQLMRVV